MTHDHLPALASAAGGHKPEHQVDELVPLDQGQTPQDELDRLDLPPEVAALLEALTAKTLLAGEVADSTAKAYASDFQQYARFVGDPAALLVPTSLERWRAAMAAPGQTYSPNTISRRVSAVQSVIRAGARLGILPKALAAAFDAVEHVKVRALRERLRPNNRTKITAAAMRRLCDAPPKDTLLGLRDRALLHTLASSGGRLSEIATLTTGQIEEREGGYVLRLLGKTDTEPRDAPLSREAHTLIQQWIRRREQFSAYIFTGQEGRGRSLQDKPLNPASVWKIVKHWAATLGLKHIKPHDFRRFVGTKLATGDIRVAQKALGHKSIETTAKHYVLDELQTGLTDELY
ncbi:MAG TPA: tyrosine-type recombinase/integrase [Roseiflexaceae bacterium]|nr:tyrosine-type recombinase/integrase [Roseiflexaceae bacterium]